MRRAALLLAIVSFLFTATVSEAADPVAKCQASKLKAWGKRRLCEEKAVAKELLGGTVDASACKTKFDAALVKAGTACRYLDNADGSVTDLDTGLMWQKSDDAGGLADKDNFYTWGSGGLPNGSAFTEFVAGLNNCLSVNGSEVTAGYAGHCDWRLPRIDELSAIADCSFGDPCIDQSAFGPTNATTTYWSATTVFNSPFIAWAVNFLDGSVVGRDKSENPSRARAVRRGL